MSTQAKKSESELKNIVLSYLEPHPNITVILFGSRATNQSSKHSDFDIGLISKGEIPPKIIRELNEIVKESHIPYHIDFVDFATVDSTFKEFALKGAIVWKGSLKN